MVTIGAKPINRNDPGDVVPRTYVRSNIYVLYVIGEYRSELGERTAASSYRR